MYTTMQHNVSNALSEHFLTISPNITYVNPTRKIFIERCISLLNIENVRNVKHI